MKRKNGRRDEEECNVLNGRCFGGRRVEEILFLFRKFPSLHFFLPVIGEVGSPDRGPEELVWSVAVSTSNISKTIMPWPTASVV
jgi:hypothetical protein